MTEKWGFLRETSEKAKIAGIDKDTGIKRTGLDEYLKCIFPDINDWIHDKVTGLVDEKGKKRKYRPDYRSEKLKMIIEFDGLDHYRSPDHCINDKNKEKFFRKNGYKVIRIPYFIQLTNKAVSCLFGRNIKEPLFDEKIPSLGIKSKNTPAYLCNLGIKRMAEDFLMFPEQYDVNISYLKSLNNIIFTGYDLLEKEMELLKANIKS